MHILVYSMVTNVTRRKAAVHYAAHFLSRANLKNLMLRSFTFVCQLYCCSSSSSSSNGGGVDRWTQVVDLYVQSVVYHSEYRTIRIH